MPEFKPRRGCVLVRAVRHSPLRPSGLAVPVSALTTTQEFVAVAIGEDVHEVAVGDRLITTVRPGSVVFLDNVGLRIIEEEKDILAVVKP